MELPTRKAESGLGANEQPVPPERKPYHSPELTSYGALFSVTQGLGVAPSDLGHGSNPT